MQGVPLAVMLDLGNITRLLSPKRSEVHRLDHRTRERQTYCWRFAIFFWLSRRDSVGSVTGGRAMASVTAAAPTKPHEAEGSKAEQSNDPEDRKTSVAAVEVIVPFMLEGSNGRTVGILQRWIEGAPTIEPRDELFESVLLLRSGQETNEVSGLCPSERLLLIPKRSRLVES